MASLLFSQRLHFDPRHAFDEGDNCGMVESAFAFVHQRNEHLLSQARERERNLQRFGGEQSVAQILLVKLDALNPGWKLRAIAVGLSR